MGVAPRIGGFLFHFRKMAVYVVIGYVLKLVRFWIKERYSFSDMILIIEAAMNE